MTAADPVATYKEFLREIVNRRPSGIRRKLAAAFCTHPSFISQVTNPGLRVPFPRTTLRNCFGCATVRPKNRTVPGSVHARASGRVAAVKGIRAPQGTSRSRFASRDLGPGTQNGAGIRHEGICKTRRVDRQSDASE